jgi:hypothetical protein
MAEAGQVLAAELAEDEPHVCRSCWDALGREADENEGVA